MIEFLPLIMFLCLLIFILLGFPVAFTLAGTAVIFGIIGWSFDAFYLSDFGFIPNRIWGVMTNYNLVAVPLFVFMGLVLEKSGIAEDLLKATGQIFRRFRGSLAYTIIIVGAILAASTGIVGATVVTMGILALPVMMKNGYDVRLATGVIASSGTLGQIIPPSIVLILLGDIMNLDVGDLFVGAIIPGSLLVGLYLLYVFALTRIRPHWIPPGGSLDESNLETKDLLTAIISPAILMFIVLGSILFGLASPTEAAACGATTALLLAYTKRRFSWDHLKATMLQTASITTMVFTLLIGAQFFGVVFRGLYGDDLIASLVENSQLSKEWILLSIMILIFILGFFLDFLEICFIIIPIILPILESLGINTLWAAILIAINLQTSFLTPPFGFALFYLKGVAGDKIATTDIYRGIVPFVAIQILAIIILACFPQLVLWLPKTIFGS